MTGVNNATVVINGQGCNSSGAVVDQRTAIAWLQLDEADEQCTQSEPRTLAPEGIRSTRLAEFTRMLDDVSGGHDRRRGYTIMGMQLASWAQEFVDAQAWDKLVSLPLRLEATKSLLARLNQEIYAWIKKYLADFLGLIPRTRRKNEFRAGFRLEMFNSTWERGLEESASNLVYE